MPPREIAKDIHWVGAVDWNIRDFHGYSTQKGTSYNNFVILDDKITLFDTVKKPYLSEMLHNLRRVVDPARIDYVVSNHAEMEHSGALPATWGRLLGAVELQRPRPGYGQTHPFCPLPRGILHFPHYRT